MQVLRQLEGLFLQAAPTVVLVFLFYLFLRANFFRPLERAMTERHRHTEGAWGEAEAAQAAALEKTEEYQDALKRARAQLYAEQDAARQGILEERASRLREARNAAQSAIARAKEEIAAELAVARAAVEREAPALAGEIARSIIERRAPNQGGAAR